MIRITGEEWKRFYADENYWPEGAWHEDEEIIINGETADTDTIDLANEVKDGDIMIVRGGTVFCDQVEPKSLEGNIRKWKKAQNYTMLLVWCPKKNVEAVTEAVKLAGGKVK